MNTNTKSKMKTIDKTALKNIDEMYKKGNIQKAIELCQYEISKNPHSSEKADLHVKLGDLYLEWHLDIYQARQFVDEAITEYQQALEIYVDSAEIYYKLGCAFYHKNELDKAINYFNIAVEKNHFYAEAYYATAECYAQKYDLQPAFDYVQKAIKVGRFYSKAHFLYYSLLRLSTKRGLKKSFLCLKEALLGYLTLFLHKSSIKDLSKKISYLKFLPSLMKSLYFIQTNNINAAIELYRQMIEKAPGVVLLYCLIGEAYRALGRYSDAICEFKMAIWLDKFNITAYKSLCAVYEEQGDYDSEAEIFRKLIKIQPYVAEYYSNLASLLYIKDDPAGAISNYQSAMNLGTRKKWTSTVAQTIGYVYQTATQNLDAAIASYQTAHILSPDDVDIYVNLGSAFYDKGEYANSLMVYKKALDISPRNAKIHCNLGYLYWGCGMMEEAIKSYELAIKYDDRYDIAFNNLGVIYLDDLGRVQKAMELFSNAINSNPNYALAYYNKARAVSIIGDNVEAAKLYQIAYDLNKISNELDPKEILEKIQGLFE